MWRDRDFGFRGFNRFFDRDNRFFDRDDFRFRRFDRDRFFNPFFGRDFRRRGWFR